VAIGASLVQATGIRIESVAAATVGRNSLVTFKVTAPTANVDVRADVIVPNRRMIKTCRFDFAPITLTLVTSGALTARLVLENVWRSMAVLAGVVRELQHVRPDVALEAEQIRVTPFKLHWMRF